MAGPHGSVVATFTPTRAVDPAELWTPHRTTDTTRDGQQGAPFGPGRSIEHEPVDHAERDAQQAARTAHVVAGQQIRAALRPL